MLRLIMMSGVLSFSTPAFAHLGHLGEAAGHAHWIGVGAIILAGGLAAAVGKFTNKDNEDELEEEIEQDGELEEAPLEG